jgi:hypothetical protein
MAAEDDGYTEYYSEFREEDEINEWTEDYEYKLEEEQTNNKICNEITYEMPTQIVEESVAVEEAATIDEPDDESKPLVNDKVN